MNASEHLAENAWKHPDSYGGFSPDGDFVVLSQHRDSELLDRVNWEVACESLKAQAYDSGSGGFETRPVVYHWRAGHWAVGWIEYLMVRADAPDDMQEKAGEILCAIAEYPILDESRYSEREWNAVQEYWASCSVRDRVDYLRDADLSIFAARRDYTPEDPSGLLFETLRTGL